MGMRKRTLSAKNVMRPRWSGEDRIAAEIATWDISRIILLRLNAIESRIGRLEAAVGELITRVSSLLSMDSRT